jgi:serine/alanine adding enzyme
VTVSAIHVVRTAPGLQAQWNDFVQRSPGSTFCHHFEWADIFRSTLRHEPYYLAATDDDGTLTGVLPLVLMRHAMLGSHLISVPFLNYGGALGPPKVRAALELEARSVAAALRIRSLQIRRYDPAAPRTAESRKVTVLLELPDSAEALWSGFPAKLRSQIRRPLKEGLRAEFGTHQVDAFYEVFARNMRDLGTPVHPRQFFHAIAQRVPGAEIAVVYKDHKAVAAGFGFHHGGEFEITWASALREYNPMSPNMLLYWSLMQRAIEAGRNLFNFGRCTPDGGTHRFKKQWGGHDVGLHWLDTAQNGGASQQDGPGSAMKLASSIWQRLPLSVTMRIGPVVSRSLPNF